MTLLRSADALTRDPAGPTDNQRHSRIQSNQRPKPDLQSGDDTDLRKKDFAIDSGVVSMSRPERD